jgi:rhodanese-related sulfurtransferase
MMMFFKRTPAIDAAEAARRLAAGDLVLVDVREPSEVAEGGIAGARTIPLGRGAAPGGARGRGRPRAGISQAGGRSATATKVALNAGYDAVNVTGGVAAWTRAGLPLAR